MDAEIVTVNDHYTDQDGITHTRELDLVWNPNTEEYDIPNVA